MIQINRKKLKRIKINDNIAIIAPSHYINDRLLSMGIKELKREELNPVLIDCTSLDDPPFSCKPEKRAQAITKAFLDPSIDAIIAARGGGGGLEILPLLSPDIFANNPKIFLGFSDITAILLMLVHQAKICSFHGPTLSKFNNGSLKNALNLLRGNSFPYEISFKNNGIQTINHGKAEGILTGGCLSLVVSLLGTPFEPNFTHTILFLEDAGEPYHRIFRMLMQLKLSGIFSSVKGVLFGPMGIKNEQAIIRRVFLNTHIPVIAGIKSGHVDCMKTLPLGVKISIDTMDEAICFLESPFLD